MRHNQAPPFRAFSHHRQSRQGGAVHLILIAVILLIGIVIGLYWQDIKQVGLPNFTVLRLQAGQVIQNAGATVSRFLSSLNFMAEPQEGGVNMSSPAIENYLPGHVGIGVLVPPRAENPITCKPVYDFTTGNIVPGKCADTENAHTAEPAAQPLDQAH